MKRFIRKAMSITTVTTETDDSGVDKETRNTVQYASLNKAKRQSRILQQANGGLGCGVLVAI